MRRIEMAAGDALADGKIRAAAAYGEAGQQVGRELIVQARPRGRRCLRERGAAEADFAVELLGGVEAGEPGAPARVVDRWRFRAST